MKCPACSYTKRYGKETIETRVCYLSGSKKGQLKRIDKRIEILDSNKEPFKEIIVEKDFKLGIMENVYEDDKGYFKEIELFACPICGCVFMKENGERE